MAKILIIDDERLITEFLREFFSERGFETRVASCGEEGLSLAEEFLPEIVLLDLLMPGIGGIETLRLIKERFPKIKVFMVTSIEAKDKMDEARRLGADNYITKPLNLDELEHEVRTKIASALKES